MNKTHQELCDENLQLRDQLEAAQASTNLARLATRQAMAKAEELERERDALEVHAERFSAAVKKADENGFGQDIPHEDESWIDDLSLARIRFTHWKVKYMPPAYLDRPVERGEA